MKIGKKSKVALGVFIALIFLGLAIPEDLIIPVKGATEKVGTITPSGMSHGVNRVYTKE